MNMLKNKKRLAGVLLLLVFLVLCLIIAWQHHLEAQQVRTFEALTGFVEQQKQGAPAEEYAPCPADRPFEPETGSKSSELSLNPAMMIASASPISGGMKQGTQSPMNAFTVRDESSEQTRNILPQYAALHAQNPDFFGWIRIEGTKVNYPVMFSPDEPERYLHRDFYGKEAKYGVPFVDGATDVERSRNLLIHGHNAKSGILFGDLDKFLSKSFFEKHRYIHFDTLYEERVYEIVAVVKTRIPKEEEDAFRYYEYVDIFSDESSLRYTSAMNSLSIYEWVQISSVREEMITLSTCSYHEENGRILLVAYRMI
jgi:sortase B